MAVCKDHLPVNFKKGLILSKSLDTSKDLAYFKGGLTTKVGNDYEIQF